MIANFVLLRQFLRRAHLPGAQSRLLVLVTAPSFGLCELWEDYPPHSVIKPLNCLTAAQIGDFFILCVCSSLSGSIAALVELAWLEIQNRVEELHRYA